MQKLALYGIVDDKAISVRKLNDVLCTDHLHFMAELVFVYEGVLTVGLEGKLYDLKSGDGMFFTPYEIHSYHTKEHNKAVIIVFSPEVLEELTAASSFHSPFFSVSRQVSEYVCNVADEEKHSTADLKAMLYPLLREFLRQRGTDTDISRYNDICRKALSYIDLNYREEITLKAVAKEIGCHPVYLSRIFSQRTGFSFVSYLNRFRVVQSLKDLKKNKLSVTEIAYKNGFGSLRSYNRAFNDCMHRTPTEYRKSGDYFHIG